MALYNSTKRDIGFKNLRTLDIEGGWRAEHLNNFYNSQKSLHFI